MGVIPTSSRYLLFIKLYLQKKKILDLSIFRQSILYRLTDILLKLWNYRLCAQVSKVEVERLLSYVKTF